MTTNTRLNELSKEDLLKEILLTPSQKLITERFSGENESTANSCRGTCQSGSCMSFV